MPFIKLQCYDDIGQLIVSGSPPKEALEKARIEIISQFNEVCPNPVSAQHLRIGKTIHYHAKKIERVTDLVEACRASYSPRLIQLLKDDGYKGEFSFETIDADLNRIEDSLRGDLHKLRKAEAEYKSLESKSEKKKPSKQQYIRTMEQYNAVFNTNKSIFQPIRVIEYATMVNTLNDHYKSLSSKEK